MLALLVGATVELSQGASPCSICAQSAFSYGDGYSEMVHVLNYYLDPLKPADVQALVSKPKRDPRDDALLQGYVLEALRECRVRMHPMLRV